MHAELHVTMLYSERVSTVVLLIMNVLLSHDHTGAC